MTESRGLCDLSRKAAGLAIFSHCIDIAFSGGDFFRWGLGGMLRCSSTLFCLLCSVCAPGTLLN